MTTRKQVEGLGEAKASLDRPADVWELKNDLARLKMLGLLDTQGYGRGAVWHLANKDAG